MIKLLIADRDQNERIGIHWLVNSYSIPFDKVLLTRSMGEMRTSIEKEVPDVLCVELDMIPKEQWDIFKAMIRQYHPKIIGMTTEATFERAMQAIELHAEDLWVKPESPGKMKRVLNHLYRQVKSAAFSQNLSPHDQQPSLSYRSLFLHDHLHHDPHSLILFELENSVKLPLLLSYLEEYDFHEEAEIFPLSEMIVYVLKLEMKDKTKFLYTKCQKLLRDWNEQHQEPLAIIAYHTEDPHLSLHEKYIQAKNALDIRFYKGYRQVTLIEREFIWRKIDPFFDYAEQRKWVDILEKGDKHQIKQLMYEEYLQFEGPYPDPALLRIKLTDVLVQARRFMKSYNLDTGSFESYYQSIFDSILQNPILYRIVQDLLLFIYEVIDMAAEQKKGFSFDVTKKAIQYIEANFNETNISLEEVASHVDRSPAYLSHILAKKEGIPFRKLLMNVRLKESKKLLLESDLTIQEIAYRTGFNQANYFSRMFKELEGISPREFRNRK